MGVEAGETSSFLSLSSAVSYGVASMAMVFVNKAVVMQYVHSMSLLTLQQLATALIIHFGQALGVSKRKDLSLTTAKKLLPVSIFYNANVAFALASLKGVNIPMYIAIKRLTPPPPLLYWCLGSYGERGSHQHRCPFRLSALLQVSLLQHSEIFPLTCMGTAWLLYQSSSRLIFVIWLHIKNLGIFLTDKMCVQMMYLILVEKSGAEDGLSSMELMLYNSILSLPFLFFIIIATGEFPHSLSVLSEKTVSLTFSAILVISLVMGIVLNFTMFWCTIVNSALTTTIVGVLTGVGSTTLGFVVLLGGVEVDALNVTGLVINTFGGVWYSYAKCIQEKKMPRKIVPDEESHNSVAL